MIVPAYDLVVFGATSFVGQLLTRHLAEYYSDGTETLRWAIADSSESKLNEVKRDLGALGKSLLIIVADAANETELRALCVQTRVMVSTVGHDALYGEPLIKACVESGTDYCDFTGEAPWIRRMVEKYEPAAQRSGARIVHCCGSDSVLSDRGVYFLQQQTSHQSDAPVVVPGLGAFLVEAAIKPIRGAMERFLLPKPGEGSSPETQLAGRFDIRFYGRTEAGQTVRVKVTGDRDPNYGSTGKMLGQAVISLAQDHVKDGSKSGRGGGFWTPVTMFDERYIERLTHYAGLRFELI